MKHFCCLLLALTILVIPSHAESNWETNKQKALSRAQAEKKPILMDFTGSDWCGFCIKLDKEVLGTPAFEQYASANVVLLKVDFPHKNPLPDDLKKQNNELQNQYKVNGFPTLVILNSAGQEVDRIAGYNSEKTNTQSLIARLEKLKNPLTPNSPTTATTPSKPEPPPISPIRYNRY